MRITGTKRGQSGNAEAPKGFEVNAPWKVRTSGSHGYLVLSSSAELMTKYADRETDFLTVDVPPIVPKLQPLSLYHILNANGT